VEKKAITEELTEISRKRIPGRITRREIRIPQPIVPSTIRNIFPSLEEQQLDLGKLNPLIKDPTVISIECDGPDKNIMIKRIREGKRITNIILDEQEIKEIIKTFSEAAKIPSHEGIFKAAVGKLIISAVISEIIGGRFLITKLSPFEYYGR
jgi:Flp pilus assembly CpaF family ATPase